MAEDKTMAYIPLEVHYKFNGETFGIEPMLLLWLITRLTPAANLLISSSVSQANSVCTFTPRQAINKHAGATTHTYIAMEALTFSTYNFGGYPGYFPLYNGNPKFKPQSWNKKGNYGVMPEIPDYFEIYKRAQLKAILSQVNPNLTPRLRKANTKEFGVQVNPKVNATVQCSLGPKTLFYREDKWDSPKTSSPLRNTLPSTPVNNVRFSRPVAIYSPVFDRRFFSVPARADELDKDATLASSEEENCAAEVETRETEAEDTWGKERQCTAFHSHVPTRFNFQVG